MKKVLFTAALLFGAFTASAQQSVVKEAKSKKGNPAEAAKIIEAALTNPETANDPNTWQLAGDLQKAIYDAEYEPYYLALQGLPTSKTADKTAMFNSLLKMFEYYMKCDEVEQAKVANGELKKPKLRKKNANTLMQARTMLPNGGIEAFNVNDYPAALKFFGYYADMVGNPMFDDKAEVLKADTLTALYATYAVMAAAQCEPKDMQAMIKYTAIGKEDKLEGWKGMQFLAEAYSNPETGDSIKWLETVKEGATRFPDQDYFIGNLTQYYLNKSQLDEALAQIDQLLAVSERPYLLYVKGAILCEKKDYTSAHATLDKVIALGGDFTADAYAKKGDCYYNPAQAIVEENAALAMEDPKYNENNEKIKEAYTLAKPFYEKAKEVSPDNQMLWGRPLLVIYYTLNLPEYETLAKELGY